MEERRPVTGITIDGPTSLDLDDALNLDGDTIQVHIADVASAVPDGSDGDKIARGRVYTKYFAAGSRPLFQGVLDESQLSLLEDKPRPTLTYQMTLDSELGISNIEIYPSMLTSRKKFNYLQADRIIRGTDKSPHSQLLARLFALAEARLAYRRKKGALAIYDLKKGWRTTEEGQLVRITPDGLHQSNVLIQEMMILGNQAVSDWLRQRNLNGPFRNHTVSTEATASVVNLYQELAEAIESGNDAIIVALRARNHHMLNRATYGPECSGHYALNIPGYVHATSPIRRYPDLLVQRSIWSSLRSEPQPYLTDELQTICAGVNLKEREVKDRRRNAHRSRKMVEARKNMAEISVFDKLSPGDFYRALKVACQESRFTPMVEQAIISRIESGLFDAREFYCLFFMGAKGEEINRLQQFAVNYLRNETHLATSILAYAKVDAGISHLRYVESSVGQDHCLVFTVQAVVGIGGSDLTSPKVQNGSLKKARKMAAVELLGVMAGVPALPSRELAIVAPAVSKKRKVKKGLAENPSGNYVGALLELCQSSGQEVLYEYVTAGLPHAPEITCTARGLGHEVVGLANNKKEAKRLAAKALFELIREPATA